MLLRLDAAFHSAVAVSRSQVACGTNAKAADREINTNIGSIDMALEEIGLKVKVRASRKRFYIG